jgi:hypothetical protein
VLLISLAELIGFRLGNQHACRGDAADRATGAVHELIHNKCTINILIVLLGMIIMVSKSISRDIHMIFQPQP